MIFKQQADPVLISTCWDHADLSIKSKSLEASAVDCWKSNCDKLELVILSHDYPTIYKWLSEVPAD